LNEFKNKRFLIGLNFNEMMDVHPPTMDELDELFAPLPDFEMSDDEKKVVETPNKQKNKIKEKKIVSKQNKISANKIFKTFEKATKKPKKYEKTQKKFIPAVPICKFYQEGRCTNENCPFRHEGPLKQKEEICKFYLSGVCQKGEDCIYSHDTKSFPCRFFFLGVCRQEKCKFSHEGEISEEKKKELKKICSGIDEQVSTQIESLENPFSKSIFEK
jgi:hypothetical protein